MITSKVEVLSYDMYDCSSSFSLFWRQRLRNGRCSLGHGQFPFNLPTHLSVRMYKIKDRQEASEDLRKALQRLEKPQKDLGGLLMASWTDGRKYYSARQPYIWAAKTWWNLIVSYVNSEPFTIVRVLIRPFPEKMNTKSLFSVLVIVLVIVITQKKWWKNHIFIATPCTGKHKFV